MPGAGQPGEDRRSTAAPSAGILGGGAPAQESNSWTGRHASVGLHGQERGVMSGSR